MFANYAIIDEYLNVLSGSTEFFKFMGALNFSSILSQVSDQDAITLRAATKYVFDNNADKSLQLELLNSNGEYRSCYIMLSPQPNDFGSRTILINIYDIVQTVSDVSAMKRHMDVMQMAIDDNSLLFEFTPSNKNMHIYRCDSTNIYTVYNGNVNDWSDSVIYENRIEDEYREAFRSFIDDIKRGSRIIKTEIAFDLFGDGSIKPYIIEGGVIINNSTVEAVGGAIKYKDPTNKVDILSDFGKDFMTGVLDKRAIVKYAKDKLETRTNENITLAMLDLDYFKDVNDVLGHSKGDEVIIKFADIIRTCIGDNGAVGRFGGDEFMVVIDDIKDTLNIREFFRAIRTATETEFKSTGDNKISVTTSIGIAPLDNIDGEPTYENMFKTADYCLYMAKEYGRNRYVIYDDRSKKNFRVDGSTAQNKYTKASRKNKFMLSMTELLFSQGIPSIPEVIKNVADQMGLDNVNIYYGKKPELMFHFGIQSPEKLSSDYIFEDDYLSNFNENSMYALSNSASIGMRMPKAYSYLKEQNIYSCVQFLIKDDKTEDIIGLLSYEVSFAPGKYWHDDEMNMLGIISQIMAQILKREKPL
ncbi:MAG: GGDEF domain-containing protein [Firmicutes bacterium]|nr:GGDEF domain-containing protein [Bacillota bacterium]